MEAIPSGKVQMVKWVRDTAKCGLRGALDIVNKELGVAGYENLRVRELELFMHNVRNTKTADRLANETTELLMTVRRFNARWNTEWTLIPNYELSPHQKIQNVNHLTAILDGGTD